MGAVVWTARGESVDGAATGANVDCTRCGTCCFSSSPRHARVTGADYDQLGDDAEQLVEFVGIEAYMKIVAVEEDGVIEPIGRCIALTVESSSDGRRFTCRVYERRPQVCRDLESASGACEGEIAGKSARQFVALERLTARSKAGRAHESS